MNVNPIVVEIYQFWTKVDRQTYISISGATLLAWLKTKTLELADEVSVPADLRWRD